MRWCLVLLSAVFTASPMAQARDDAAMRYLYNAPESASDTRYAYHWQILRTALEKTRTDYGPYVLEPSQVMSEKRQTYELTNATGHLTVMYQSETRELERLLIPVRIAVDRNLAGYRILLIRKEDRARFAAIRSLEDLRTFRYGAGLDWIDVDILQSNGLRVVTGSSYEGLFEMLANRRFDVFPRGAVEIIDEFQQRRSGLPELEIEPNLALYFPQPSYFWFPRTPEGQRLAARAEAGMRRMILDGSYDRIFAEYQDPKIRQLRLSERRIFPIGNPHLGPEVPLSDMRRWFDPKTYHPH